MVWVFLPGRAHFPGWLAGHLGGDAGRIGVLERTSARSPVLRDASHAHV
jgi:hypothetical protein